MKAVTSKTQSTAEKLKGMHNFGTGNMTWEYKSGTWNFLVIDLIIKIRSIREREVPMKKCLHFFEQRNSDDLAFWQKNFHNLFETNPLSDTKDSQYVYHTKWNVTFFWWTLMHKCFAKGIVKYWLCFSCSRGNRKVWICANILKTLTTFVILTSAQKQFPVAHISLEKCYRYMYSKIIVSLLTLTEGLQSEHSIINQSRKWNLTSKYKRRLLCDPSLFR